MIVCVDMDNCRRGRIVICKTIGCIITIGAGVCPREVDTNSGVAMGVGADMEGERPTPPPPAKKKKRKKKGKKKKEKKV